MSNVAMESSLLHVDHCMDVTFPLSHVHYF